MKNIVLYGMRGSGKTTIGKQLAKKLGFLFFDLDKVISEHVGMKIFDFIEKQGWDEFRKIESHLLKQTMNDKSDKVVSLGGGTLCYFDNVNFIHNESDKTIYIKSDIKDIIKRIQSDEESGNKRNALLGDGLLSELNSVFDQRKNIYESNFDFYVNNNSDIKSVVTRIYNYLSYGDICIPLTDFSNQNIKIYNQVSTQLSIVKYLELRVDLLENHLDTQSKDLLINNSYEKVITNRHSDEGGNFKGSYDKSIEKLLEFKNIGSYFDIELRAGKSIETLRDKLGKDKNIIISYHNFEATPSLGELESIIKQMDEYSPDVYKIALMPQSMQDVKTLYQLQDYMNENYKGKDYIFISMGELGKETRYKVLKNGGFFGFASLGTKISAPGQINYLDMYNNLFDEKIITGKEGCFLT